MKKTRTQSQSSKVQSEFAVELPDPFAETICGWAQERGIQRLRSDRRVGYPDQEHLAAWSRIFEQRGIKKSEDAVAVLDAATVAATRSGEWRNWAFLTLQVQLAAERLPTVSPAPEASTIPLWDIPDEDPTCDWALAKQKIRERIGQVPFSNWFDRTRQIQRQEGHIAIAVPDQATRLFIEEEYGNVMRAVLAEFGIEKLELSPALADLKTH